MTFDPNRYTAAEFTDPNPRGTTHIETSEKHTRRVYNIDVKCCMLL